MSRLSARPGPIAAKPARDRGQPDVSLRWPPRRRPLLPAFAALGALSLTVPHNVVYAIDTTNGRAIPLGKEPHGLTVWPQPGRYSLGHTGNMR